MADNEPHQALGEWLRIMGYPKNNFPSEDQLKMVCRGSIFRCFWKNVLKRFKPRQEVNFIKENIFVKSIRSYERIEGSTKAKIGQVLPPTPLHLWKKCIEKEELLKQLRLDQEHNELILCDRLNKQELKYDQTIHLRYSIENAKREVHLMTEAIRQLKKDITHSKESIDIILKIPLAKNIKLMNEHNSEIDIFEEFLHLSINDRDQESKTSLTCSETSKICDAQSVYECLVKALSSDSEFEVETTLRNVNVSELFQFLLKKRDSMINAVLQQKKIEDELTLVETKSHAKGVLPWKQSISTLNLMHCNLMVSALQHKKEIRELLFRLDDLLKSKIINAKIPKSNIEIIKYRCKHLELSAYIDVFKDFIETSLNGGGIFTANVPKMNPLQQQYSFDKLKNDILTVYSWYGVKQLEVQGDISKLSKSVGFMKDIRKTTLNILGYNDFSFSDFETINDSLHFSKFNPNATSNKLANNKGIKNLIDAKHMFSEANINKLIFEDIENISIILSREIDSIRNFGLDRNRRLVLENGEKIWINETLHHYPCLRLDDQYVLFKCINPFLNVIGVLNVFVNYLKWKNALELLALNVNKKIPQNIQPEDDCLLNNESSDQRIDDVLKKVKKSLRSLHSMNETVGNIEKKITFFMKAEVKKYISNDRKLNGKDFGVIENEIKHLMIEESYWS